MHLRVHSSRLKIWSPSACLPEVVQWSKASEVICTEVSCIEGPSQNAPERNLTPYICLPVDRGSKENVVHLWNMAGVSCIRPSFTSSYQQSVPTDCSHRNQNRRLSPSYPKGQSLVMSGYSGKFVVINHRCKVLAHGKMKVKASFPGIAWFIHLGPQTLLTLGMSGEELQDFDGSTVQPGSVFRVAKCQRSLAILLSQRGHNVCICRIAASFNGATSIRS